MTDLLRPPPMTTPRAQIFEMTPYGFKSDVFSIGVTVHSIVVRRREASQGAVGFRRTAGRCSKLTAVSAYALVRRARVPGRAAAAEDHPSNHRPAPQGRAAHDARGRQHGSGESSAASATSVHTRWGPLRIILSFSPTLSPDPLQRNFIQSLVTPDPVSRPSAKAALRHPWIRAGEDPAKRDARRGAGADASKLLLPLSLLRIVRFSVMIRGKTGLAFAVRSPIALCAATRVAPGRGAHQEGAGGAARQADPPAPQLVHRCCEGRPDVEGVRVADRNHPGAWLAQCRRSCGGGGIYWSDIFYF